MSGGEGEADDLMAALGSAVDRARERRRTGRDGEGVQVEARPQRIQRKRTKGWRMPDGAVYVGRPTAWGNPWVLGDLVTVDGIGSDGQMVCSTITLTPAMAVECYRDLMAGRLSYEGTDHPADRSYVDGWHEALALLTGRDLACWCPLDRPCHADVLLELANPGLVLDNDTNQED